MSVDVRTLSSVDACGMHIVSPRWFAELGLCRFGLRGRPVTFGAVRSRWRYVGSTRKPMISPVVAGFSPLLGSAVCSLGEKTVSSIGAVG